MTNIITRKDLGKGLELRVEPSFRFTHTEGSSRMPVCRIIKKQESEGLDISLYRNGKLCLSSQDSYYHLQAYESQVDRSLSRKQVIPTFVQLAKELTKTMPSELRRVYEIYDADITPINFNYQDNDYIRLTRMVNGLKHDVLFSFSKKQSNPNLIKNFWGKKYPTRTADNVRLPDKYLGHTFSIYFVDPEKFEHGRPFERVLSIRYNVGSDNSAIIKESKATIMSLSYGYRMRVLGDFPEDILR